MSSKKFLAIKIMVSFSLIAFLLHRADAGKLLSSLINVRIPYLIFASALMVISIVLQSYRWKVNLSLQDIKVPLRKLTAMFWVGLFFNNFMPTSIGGDAVKMIDLSRHTKKKMESVLSILVDRTIGLTSLSIISFIGLVLGRELIVDETIFNLAFWFFIFFWAFLVLLLVGSSRRLVGKYKPVYYLLNQLGVREKVKRAYAVLNNYKNSKLGLIKVVLISLTFQIIVVFEIYLISLAIGMNTPLAYFFIFVPIICVVSMTPVTLNGVGVRDWAFTILFTSVGASYENAALLSFLTYGMIILTSGVGGIIYATRR